jgi:hypothetical protein
MLGASLDYYRDVRDAASEAAFFQVYGNVLAVDAGAARPSPAAAAPVREEAFARKVLERIASGGYAEAVARVAALLAKHGQPIPLARLELKRELVRKYDDLLPRLKAEEWHRVRGGQEVAVSLEPQRALATLGELVPAPRDRERLLALIGHVIDEGRDRGVSPTEEQQAMLAGIRAALADGGAARLRKPAARRRAKAAR